MKSQALDFYMHDGPTAFQFELAGDLNHEGARRLDRAWRTASPVIGDRKLIVDMTFVTSADEQGRALLACWYRERARLVANSKSSRELAESIVGERLPEPTAGAGASERTRHPFRTFFRGSAVFAVMFPVILNAATLRSNRVGACNKYLQTSNGSLQDRVRPGGAFIWPFEDGPLGIKVTIISPGSFRIDFAGTSTAMHEGQPQSPLADKTAQFRRDYNCKQPIQPAKAAAAVLNIARLDDPPLRLALGGDAVRFVERNDVAGGNPTGCGST